MSVVEQLTEGAVVGRWRTISGDVNPFGPQMVGYDVTREVLADRLEQSRAIVGLAMAPAPGDLIVGELTRLHLVTASQDIHEHDLEAMFTFYADELEDQGYPLDVVTTACRQSGRVLKFWPALAELVARCDGLMRERRMLDAALRCGPPPRLSEEIARRRQYAADKAAREASAAEWRAANPDAGPALTPMQAIRGDVVTEDWLALQKRVAEQKNAPPLSETDPAVKALMDSWAKQMGLTEEAEPKPEEERDDPT
jgi:hypothetical protein